MISTLFAARSGTAFRARGSHVSSWRCRAGAACMLCVAKIYPVPGHISSKSFLSSLQALPSNLSPFFLWQQCLCLRISSSSASESLAVTYSEIWRHNGHHQATALAKAHQVSLWWRCWVNSLFSSCHIVGYFPLIHSFFYFHFFALITTCRMGATFFVQPLDLVKNRMQLSGKFVLPVFKVLILSRCFRSWMIWWFSIAIMVKPAQLFCIPELKFNV